MGEQMMYLNAFVNQLLSTLRSASLASLLILCLGGVLAYFSSLTLYRLTLHPLAKYPGRFIDRVSSWPLVYQCYSGNRHLRLLEAHRKYGPVVRIAPNQLDFDTETAHTAVHRDRAANVKKSDWYKLEPAFSGDFSVQTVIDKKEHDFRRRVLQPAFSDSALRAQEQFIDNNVRIFLAKAGEDVQSDGWTSPKEFSELITRWGFDFISDLAFGSRFGLLEDETHRYLPNLLKWASHFVYYAGYLPFAPLVRLIVGTPLMAIVPNAAARDAQKYFDASERKLKERQAIEEAVEPGSEPRRKDIFHYLIQSRDPDSGVGFTHAQLMADSGLLISAGSDGVAVTVAAAIFYLLQSPVCMDKTTQEVRDSFATFDEVRGPKLQQLPYLAAVVSEALRLAPSVPSGFPREVMPGGLRVDGLYVPAGTVVSVSAYAVHHNEAYFPDSFNFRPERWLGDGESVSGARRALCTFGAGRFDCVGKNIAILACKLVIGKTLYKYDLRAANGTLTGGGSRFEEKGREREDEYQLIDYLVSYRSGPLVEFRLRE